MRIIIDTSKSLAKATDRASRGGGVSTPIEPGIVSRVAQGIKYMITGAGPDAWFGPSQPMQPAAQEIKGRVLDYPTGYNLSITKRPYEGVTHDQMRALAENYDILRLCIETRKDQIERMEWKFKQRDDGTGKRIYKPSSQAQEQIKKAVAFLEYPDGENDFGRWLRIILEDMFVIDAATIYPRKTKGGQPYSFDVIDGATIVRRINADGRTPDPPDVAYQQILKGIPAVDFSRDELIYFPRNLRSWKFYGYSHVEQIVRYVNIGIRRMIHQLQYYTEGNVPEALVGVPESWTVEQIAEFQQYWDDLMEGNTAQRRHAKFVPGEISKNIHETKASMLTDEADEWLARIVCYCFSLSPQPFVKIMNRATAENAQQMAQQEGLEPLLKWVKRLMDYLVWKYLDLKLIEFEWAAQQEPAPLEQAQIDEIYTRSKIKRVNEIRDRNGDEPLSDEELHPPSPFGDPFSPESGGRNPFGKEPAPVPPDRKKEGGADAEKLAKGKKKLSRIDRDRDTVLEARAQLKKVLAKLFEKGKKEARNVTMPEIGAEKLTPDQQAQVAQIMKQLKLEGWSVMMDASEEVLAWITKDGIYKALLQIGMSDEAITEAMSTKAFAYAKQRAAELVGKRILPDGTIIDNPNQKWFIEQGTRDLVRGDVAKAVEEGWSTKKLQDALEGSYAFSEDRAETIARTEIALADSRGNAIAYKESGVVSGKEWILGSEHDDDDE